MPSMRMRSNPKRPKLRVPLRATDVLLWRERLSEGKGRLRVWVTSNPKKPNLRVPLRATNVLLWRDKLSEGKGRLRVSTSRTDFESKYRELHKLGTGGFGYVFAGIRVQDAYTVAIKHLPWDNVLYRNVVKNGIMYKMIDEVALMVKLAQDSCPAVVQMLDCYDFPQEFILVMERPNPAMDLFHYKTSQGGVLKEEEAKNILEQVMDASIQMHNSGVFHRDVKPENILVEFGQEFLKAWIIDFGCGCLVKEGTYDHYSGTNSLAPPEWYSSKAYRAEPTTVYHLGALLYDLLHYKAFSTCAYLRKKRRFRTDLSKECLSFLKSCLAKDPDRRPSFETLQHHPLFF